MLADSRHTPCLPYRDIGRPTCWIILSLRWHEPSFVSAGLAYAARYHRRLEPSGADDYAASTVDPVEVLSVLILVAAIPTSFWNISQVRDNRLSERIGQQVAYVFG